MNILDQARLCTVSPSQARPTVPNHRGTGAANSCPLAPCMALELTSWAKPGPIGGSEAQRTSSCTNDEPTRVEAAVSRGAGQSTVVFTRLAKVGATVLRRAVGG